MVPQSEFKAVKKSKERLNENEQRRTAVFGKI